LATCALQASFVALNFIFPLFKPSRLFLYYNTRVLIQNISPLRNSGVSIPHIWISLQKFNVCDESFWPYITKNFAIKPPSSAYLNASPIQCSLYHVPIHLHTITFILDLHLTIIFGLAIFKDFFSIPFNGKVSTPYSFQNFVATHSMLLCGYDFPNKLFIVMNSWGDKWGHNGFCYIHFDYITNPKLAKDFFTFSSFPLHNFYSLVPS
jgi:hypothetical protein